MNDVTPGSSRTAGSLPVILALAATGVTARSSSSSAMATMAVVNGPIRHETGMNSGTGAPCRSWP